MRGPRGAGAGGGGRGRAAGTGTFQGTIIIRKCLELGSETWQSKSLLESRGALSQAGRPVRGKTGTGTQDS